MNQILHPQDLLGFCQVDPHSDIINRTSFRVDFGNCKFTPLQLYCVTFFDIQLLLNLTPNHHLPGSHFGQQRLLHTAVLNWNLTTRTYNDNLDVMFFPRNSFRNAGQ